MRRVTSNRGKKTPGVDGVVRMAAREKGGDPYSDQKRKTSLLSLFTLFDRFVAR